MTPEQFAYWLQGFVELNVQQPTDAQWDSIKEHLQTVFKKVTSSVPPTGPVPRGGLEQLRGSALDQTLLSLSC